MNTQDEIRKRLDIIATLESLKFRIEPRSREGTYETYAYVIYTDSTQQEMFKEYIPIYDNRRELFGELPKAITEINAFIKTTLEPLINTQKTKIKELL